MNPVRAFQLFLLRVLGFGAIAGYLLSLFQPPTSPALLRARPYACSVALSFVVQFLYYGIIYPKLLDPLRALPTVSGVNRPFRPVVGNR